MHFFFGSIGKIVKMIKNIVVDERQKLLDRKQSDIFASLSIKCYFIRKLTKFS